MQAAYRNNYRNTRKGLKYFIAIILLLNYFFISAQTDSVRPGKTIITDSGLLSRQHDTAFLRRQEDLIDIFLKIIRKDPAIRFEKNKSENLHIHFSGAPSPSYSLATGIAFNVTGSFAFYVSEDMKTNISSVLLSPIITAKQQLVVPLQFSIWTKDNKFNIQGDWRFLKYPEDTYGLGGTTTDADAVQLDYDQIRLYTFVLKTLGKNFYAGLGYQYDNHWNIAQLGVPPNTVTDFDKYGFNSSSISSGISADVLLDTRTNSINPEAGSTYANIVFRQNLQALGSDANWSSLLIDARKYFRLSDRSDNILAIWSYNWLTVSGKPPYMDLPSTGWDAYSNTGRGYVQSRFRAKNMIDLETEYRFGIMRNGLLGGVVFANAQTYSETAGNLLKPIIPGWGAGLRIKFNKFSKTNICLDYGFGLHGSNGLFVNLGEVF